MYEYMGLLIIIVSIMGAIALLIVTIQALIEYRKQKKANDRLNELFRKK